MYSNMICFKTKNTITLGKDFSIAEISIQHTVCYQVIALNEFSILIGQKVSADAPNCRLWYSVVCLSFLKDVSTDRAL